MQQQQQLRQHSDPRVVFRPLVAAMAAGPCRAVAAVPDRGRRAGRRRLHGLHHCFENGRLWTVPTKLQGGDGRKTERQVMAL